MWRAGCDRGGGRAAGGRGLSRPPRFPGLQVAGGGLCRRADGVEARAGYSSGTHYAPHAAASATSPTGPRMAATAMASGLSFEIGERGRLAAGISVPRHLLPPCWGDEATCAAGLAARERYPSDWNPDRPVFSLHPAHSRSSHAADALRTFAVGYQDEVDLAQYTPPPSSVLYFNPFTYGKR